MGGGAMRTAAKVAGIGIANSGIRSGLSGLPASTEQSVRNASRPVSAIISSSARADAPVQRPVSELDDWELAGGLEDELALELAEPLPRLVFGGAPTLQEARDATTELKDALNKVYLSSPLGSSLGDDQLNLPLLGNSDHVETKGCISFQSKETVPKNAIMAFQFLNESPQAQSVVASIASDPNVWDAVLKNEDLQVFLKSQKTDVTVEDVASPKSFKEMSEDDKNEDLSTTTEPLGLLESIKVTALDIKDTVVTMVNNFPSQLQKFFGYSSTEVDAEEKSRPVFNEIAMGASLMGLAVMVIMLVVLKRG
ncbi:hypothetical protein Tsubulata_030914 [Turnera subulata]|uniref:Uncharacterized protein n=1 Tax=Turnera subulata TaxID=218843 RepID=A0A9Q0JMN7_9ROSI|nr:hypothetical protein Tsubulata_030914 [Turnera subulata]